MHHAGRGIAFCLLVYSVAGCARSTSPPAPTVPQQEGVVGGDYYTLGVWRVKQGREAEFIDAWKAVGAAFLQLPDPPGPGTLIRSESDPALFYSFGPWQRLEDIQAMRDDPRSRAALNELISLCTEASPGTYRLVAEVSGGSSR